MTTTCPCPITPNQCSLYTQHINNNDTNNGLLLGVTNMTRCSLEAQRCARQTCVISISPPAIDHFTRFEHR